MDSSPGIGDVHAYLSVDQTRQLLFSSPEIQSFEIAYSPLPPQSLLVPEKLFASIKAYYCGAFAEGLFKTGNDGYLIHVNGAATYNQLYEFHELHMTGAGLMNSEFFVEGRRCLSKALALVSNILCNQDPRTLESILSLLIFLRKEGHNRISTILGDLVGRMAIVLFDKEHSWRQIFSQIGTLDDSHFEPAIAEAWRCTCDILANTLGQFHRTALLCYTRFTNIVHGHNGATQLLYNLLIQGEQELGKFDERLLFIKFMYGQALSFQGRNFEAVAVLEEVLTHCCEVEEQNYEKIRALELISLCEYYRGDNYKAESKIRQAIKMAEERFGKFDSILLSLKARLEEWLREWGREAEAAAMKAEIDEILGPDDIELEDVTH
jgi:tetratricopeptide (TPR) repeat protein